MQNGEKAKEISGTMLSIICTIDWQVFVKINDSKNRQFDYFANVTF